MLPARLTSNLRPSEATEIFLIGIGNAFYGVANLLINRGREPPCGAGHEQS